MTWWTGKRLAVGLLASVALNLFLAGMLVVLVAVDGGERHRRGIFDFRSAVMELSPEARGQIRELWRDRRQTLRPRFQEFHEARRHLRDLLIVEGELDRAAIAEARGGLAESATELQVALFDLMVSVAEALPPDERRRFFRTALRRGRHHAH